MNMRYHLSLGSNLGNRRLHLSQALMALEKAKVKVLRCSSLYRTQPVGFAAQPWFCNQVVEVSTDLDPSEFLALIKKVETDMGRRPAPRNRPRPIDIDILFAENRIMATRRLTVPHPRMIERNFVLIPLLEIAPKAVHPSLKEPISNLYKKSRDKSLVEKMPSPPGRSSSRESAHPCEKSP